MFSVSQYQQLRPEERMTIAAMKLQGASARAMAKLLGRSPSTISRELRRNVDDQGGYDSHRAAAISVLRRHQGRPQRKLDPQGVARGVVLTLLTWKWAPQQIAATLRRVFSDDPSRHVSHETIYTAINALPRGELKRDLLAYLRQGKSSRMPRSRGTDRRGQTPEMVSIHVRPSEVNDRVMPGHWEGDLFKGAHNQSAVGVLVKRVSRLVLLARMPDATAESALAAFTAKLNSIAAPMRQSLTYDQGREMACHRELARAANIRVYFCDPRSPGQRGTCENTNGLLRQYLPKGTDFVRLHAGRT